MSAIRVLPHFRYCWRIPARRSAGDWARCAPQEGGNPQPPKLRANSPAVSKVRENQRVVKFYNGRGTAEQWIKEGKNALKWTWLSCRRFKDNQVRLQLFALAYILANFLRQLALPRPVRTWTLTTLREKLIKIGARVVRHAKAVTFQMAEVAVPRELCAAILGRIDRLREAPSSG